MRKILAFLWVTTSILFVAGCGSSTTPAVTTTSAPSNACTYIQDALVQDKNSIPAKAGVLSIHDLVPNTVIVVPKSFKSDAEVPSINQSCTGLADYQDLPDVPVTILLTPKGHYWFLRNWDYAELLKGKGDALVIVRPKNRECQIPQDHFNAIIEAMKLGADGKLSSSAFTQRVTNLINNLEGDSTVIGNETVGDDSTYVPLLISEISLGWTQMTLQNVSQGFFSSVAKFSVHCRG
jgi:hypothetical protein